MVKGLHGPSGAGKKSFKAHANGIKKMPNFFKKSMKGTDPKYLRNMKYAQKWNKGGRPKTDE
eukprot:CAMPEP_0119471024 /NCGR_PEP_ID=MMETSP1344-20130328/3665_1 /TAXON_ID=236787 /ORGANISM="Florenciella parvula, Strain CCMP2471" /LENGTH=61 /DNA_ID=CAMNT_0007503759 /DNA_START=96 /DNA_END=281 /DNA_ORIENTATION=+